MFGLGPTELVVILLLVLLLFGAKKIPELLRGLGTGLKEFRKAAKDESVEQEPENKGSGDA